MKKTSIMKIPEAGKDLQYYAKYLGSLEGDRMSFDRNLGYIRWLQGHALIEAKKNCDHGEWETFLAKIGWTASSAKMCRKIAEVILAENASKLSYTEMLETAYPETYGSKRKKGKGKKNQKGFHKVKQSLKSVLKSLQDLGDVVLSNCDETCIEEFDTAITLCETIGNEADRLIVSFNERIAALRNTKEAA